MSKNRLLTAIVLYSRVAPVPMQAEINLVLRLPPADPRLPTGIDMANAINMALEDLNAKGGVLGQKYTTSTADHGRRSPDGHRGGQQAHGPSEVTAAVKGYCSGATLLTLKIYADAAHPLHHLRGPLKEKSTDCTRATPSFNQRPGHLSGERAGPVQENERQRPSRGQRGRRLLRRPGQPHRDQVGSCRAARRRPTSWWPRVSRTRRLVTTLKSSNPDMIFLTAYFADGGLLIKQLRQGGYRGEDHGGRRLHRRQPDQDRRQGHREHLRHGQPALGIGAQGQGVRHPLQGQVPPGSL